MTDEEEIKKIEDEIAKVQAEADAMAGVSAPEEYQEQSVQLQEVSAEKAQEEAPSSSFDIQNFLKEVDAQAEAEAKAMNITQPQPAKEPEPQKKEPKLDANITQEDLWRVDNYNLLKDYLDRTISRIAARCVRTGNIAMEEYPFYGYILDVLEEICETGDYILERPYLSNIVDEKIAGGIKTLSKRIDEFKVELQNNSSPDMIKDEGDLDAAKAILGIDGFDPTEGAGMSMDDVVAKLADKHNQEIDAQELTAEEDE